MKISNVATVSGCLILLAVLLTGCGNSNDSQKNQNGKSPQQTVPSDNQTH